MLAYHCSTINSLVGRVRLWLVNKELIPYFTLLVYLFRFIRKIMVFLPQELSKSGSGLTIKMELQTAIQTLYSWYRTMLIHTVFQRLQFADLPIRPFTLQRAVYSWNDISLLKLNSLLRNMFLYFNYKIIYIISGSTFFWNPRLQAGKKLPKWTPRSTLGSFMGYSLVHSSTISLILNSQTCAITPQYRLDYDD